MRIVGLPKRKRIAIVELFGAIGGSVKSPVYDRILSSVGKDRRVAALVLDVDSPGGGVSASDYLYRSVARIAEKKPVVASIRGAGTSGAYLISCAAHRVVAAPGAVVGSIGVISIRPALQQLMERLGIGVDVSKSGALKDMGAFWRNDTPEEREKLQALVDSYHDTFVSIVAKARRIDEDRVRELATRRGVLGPRGHGEGPRGRAGRPGPGRRSRGGAVGRPQATVLRQAEARLQGAAPGAHRRVAGRVCGRGGRAPSVAGPSQVTDRSISRRSTEKP